MRWVTGGTVAAATAGMAIGFALAVLTAIIAGAL
jgi:tetrahydromethanopterin S-methyltransferase subunit F